MAANRAHRLTRIDYWPGFVDAMATLLLVFVFLLSVFILAQFFLGQEVTSKDTVLTRLNAQIAELTELLALEKIRLARPAGDDRDAAGQSRLVGGRSGSPAGDDRFERVRAEGAGGRAASRRLRAT